MSNPALDAWNEFCGEIPSGERWKVSLAFFAGFACGASGVRQDIEQIVAAFKTISPNEPGARS